MQNLSSFFYLVEIKSEDNLPPAAPLVPHIWYEDCSTSVELPRSSLSMCMYPVGSVCRALRATLPQYVHTLIPPTKQEYNLQAHTITRQSNKNH